MWSIMDRPKLWATVNNVKQDEKGSPRRVSGLVPKSASRSIRGTILHESIRGHQTRITHSATTTDAWQIPHSWQLSRQLGPSTDRDLATALGFITAPALSRAEHCLRPHNPPEGQDHCKGNLLRRSPAREPGRRSSPPNATFSTAGPSPVELS